MSEPVIRLQGLSSLTIWSLNQAHPFQDTSISYSSSSYLSTVLTSALHCSASSSIFIGGVVIETMRGRGKQALVKTEKARAVSPLLFCNSETSTRPALTATACTVWLAAPIREKNRYMGPSTDVELQIIKPQR